MFETAKTLNLIEELEQACIEVSCSAFKQTNNPNKLFLNISPHSLIQGNTEKTIAELLFKKLDFDPEQIVIELSERYPVEDYEVIRAAINYYRDMKLNIAIDDLGSGYSGLRVWSEIKPDYVKIDQHFIRNINTDPVKREFVRSIHEISLSLNCHVVAEGIETEDELSAIRIIGISHGQGYLLGKPIPTPEEKLHPLVTNGYIQNDEKSHGFNDTIADLVDYQKPIKPGCQLDVVAEIFKKNKNLLSIPIVDNNKPVGIVIRHHILEIFLGMYGRELHAKKPVTQFMYSHPVIVERSSLLKSVSKLIANDNVSNQMNMDFIIVENEKYVGVGHIQKLLEKLTEHQIRTARYANPLTMLPGNVPIYEWIDECLKMKTDFHVAYCDLNYFKPYNDKYGYSRGDEVISWLGELLQSSISEQQDRIGHIGGDDFVIIFQSHDWELKCASILKAFENQISYFYNPDDIAMDGISGVDRTGNEQFFPLLGLSIGVVNPDPELCTTHHSVSELATMAKSEAKKMGNNALFISRRRVPTKISQTENKKLAV